MKDFHSNIYLKAMHVASKVEIEKSMPKTTSCQQHRNNVTATSVSEYYKRQLTIPILDFLINEIGYRFNDSAIMSANLCFCFHLQ